MSQDESRARESIRRVTRNFMTALIVAYMVGMSCAVPYYNVSYAAEKGFDHWFLGGEFAATAKVGNSINPSLIEPDSPGNTEVGRDIDAVTAISIEQRGIFSIHPGSF